MGMGGPREEESHEVTVELEGEVSEAAFEEYIDRLHKCLAELAAIVDAKNGGGKLKVRLVGMRIKRRR